MAFVVKQSAEIESHHLLHTSSQRRARSELHVAERARDCHLGRAGPRAVLVSTKGMTGKFGQMNISSELYGHHQLSPTPPTKRECRGSNGGIHFEDGNREGLALGRKVGAVVFEKARRFWEGGV